MTVVAETLMVPAHWPHTLEDLSLRMHHGCPLDVLRAYAQALRLIEDAPESADAALLLALGLRPFAAEFGGVRMTIYGFDTGTDDDAGARPAFTLKTAKMLWSMLTDDPWLTAATETVEIGGVERYCFAIPRTRWVRV